METAVSAPEPNFAPVAGDPTVSEPSLSSASALRWCLPAGVRAPRRLHGPEHVRRAGALAWNYAKVLLANCCTANCCLAALPTAVLPTAVLLHYQLLYCSTAVLLHYQLLYCSTAVLLHYQLLYCSTAVLLHYQLLSCQVLYCSTACGDSCFRR
ncbi:hypothetical protein [Actinoplanes sp. URMC 104]|uniref:hypothetical protein n=1 Tax=Actinoplanes sp. URMC 104 TaxID=3423409 RepID=UPI003F1DB618